MSEFAVIAELPLGAYRARTRGGHLDPVPSPVRLHAALLCAAATGPRAVAAGPDLRPNADDLSTLHWLEQHPPDGVLVPQYGAGADDDLRIPTGGDHHRGGSPPGAGQGRRAGDGGSCHGRRRLRLDLEGPTAPRDPQESGRTLRGRRLPRQRRHPGADAGRPSATYTPPRAGGRPVRHRRWSRRRRSHRRTYGRADRGALSEPQTA